MDKHLTRTLYELIQQGRVKVLGSIRQELLSGIREEPQFSRIRDNMREFPDVSLDASDYEEAARISNECRGAGIAASPVDMLICAVSLRRGWEIFTMDRDFVHFRRVIPLRLLSLH